MTNMRRITLLLLLILSCSVLQAQDQVPAELQQRLTTFTDQLWASWMKSGDIRSVASMRVPEIVNDPPCGLVRFTDERVCQQLSKEERAEYAQTVDNMTTLMNRILSRQPVLEWLASLNTVIDTDISGNASMNQIFKSASVSSTESSLINELTGFVKDVDDFRRRTPRYRELESLLQADHLKDYSGPDNQTKYKENVAILDQAFKDEGTVSKVDPPQEAGLPPGGDYYVVRRGAFIFVVRTMKDELRLAFVQTVTK
jgi:hypothetical protein